MEQSILTSTKQKLNLSESYDAFDDDVASYINSAFAVLHGLGVGPVNGFVIEDKSTTWNDYGTSDPITSLVKTYVFLKARLLFDPPTLSFVITNMKEQIQEYEWRLEAMANPAPSLTDVVVVEEV